jgi:hypothetical protein
MEIIRHKSGFWPKSGFWKSSIIQQVRFLKEALTKNNIDNKYQKKQLEKDYLELN